MHSKFKGNLGQFACALKFAEHEYSVFTEEGDISKLDLIAEKSGKIIRVQCKAVTATNGTLVCTAKKSGPGYQFYYDLSAVDFFSLYDLESKNLYLIPAKDFISADGTYFSLRVSETKNKQIKRIKLAENYLFDRVLRDYEQNACKSDDIVQTTTRKRPAKVGVVG
jgi:hypothetical protein